MYGVDVSEHNGDVNYDLLRKNGNEFVIIRAGYGFSLTQKDKMFERNYELAKASGLKVGIYWYSYALNEQQAVQEAKVCLECIKNKQLDGPVYFDMEDADGYKRNHGMPSHDMLVRICHSFCEVIAQAGYHVGVYASESWFLNQLKNLSGAYHRWVASWGSNNGELQVKKVDYPIHQFTSEYRLQNKRFDRNIIYNVSMIFPSMKAATISRNDILDIVYQVFLGKYGNAQERKVALGNRYEEIQSFINHIFQADIEILVQETLQGKYGNDDVRRVVLNSRYEEVQKRINNVHNVYTIQSGDTLTSISQKFQISIDELLKLNSWIENKNVIFPGKQLKLK